MTKKYGLWPLDFIFIDGLGLKVATMATKYIALALGPNVKNFFVAVIY
jgi:hypothetical protein